LESIIRIFINIHDYDNNILFQDGSVIAWLCLVHPVTKKYKLKRMDMVDVHVERALK